MSPSVSTAHTLISRDGEKQRKDDGAAGPRRQSLMDYRTVKHVFLGTVLEKDRHVRLSRFLGPDTVTEASPFLVLETMELKTARDFAHGFPWRPCAGVESILYFIQAPKSVAKAEKSAEDPHWIQLGIDQVEECIPDLPGPLLGTQIWTASADKTLSLEPVTNAPSKETAAGVQVRVVAGSFADADVLTKTASGSVVLDVFMECHAQWDVSVLRDSTILAYILEGSGYFEENQDEIFSKGRALLFSQGVDLFLKAGARGLRFLLLAAPPTSAPAPKWDQVKKTEDEWLELLDEEEIENAKR